MRLALELVNFASGVRVLVTGCGSVLKDPKIPVKVQIRLLGLLVPSVEVITLERGVKINKDLLIRLVHSLILVRDELLLNQTLSLEINVLYLRPKVQHPVLKVVLFRNPQDNNEDVPPVRLHRKHLILRPFLVI